jgi:hypothetical protein
MALKVIIVILNGLMLNVAEKQNLVVLFESRIYSLIVDRMEILLTLSTC